MFTDIRSTVTTNTNNNFFDDFSTINARKLVSSCRLNFSCPKLELAANVEYIGYVYVQSVICSVGLLLNIINFSVFVRRCFQTSTFIYMSALSFADGCTLLIKLPSCFVKVKGANLQELRFGLTYYIHYFETPLSSMCETVSVWLTLTLAIERFIAMRYYSFSRTACTPINARLIICCLVGISFVLNAPQFFLFKNHRHRDHEGNSCLISDPTEFYKSTGYKLYSWFRNIVVQFAPLIGLIVANFCLLILVQRHERRMKTSVSTPTTALRYISQNSGGGGGSTPIATEYSIKSRTTPRSASTRRTRAQQKLTILLIVVIFLFLFGQIPQALAYHKVFKALFGRWLCPCMYKDYVGTCPIYKIYRTIAQCLVLCAYSSTFFIYLALNRHFRNFLYDMCGKSRSMEETHQMNGIFTDGLTQHQYSKTDKSVYAVVPTGTIARDHLSCTPMISQRPSSQMENVLMNENGIKENLEDCPLTLLCTEL